MQASRRGRTADAQPRSVTSNDGCPRAGLNQSATFPLHPPSLGREGGGNRTCMMGRGRGSPHRGGHCAAFASRSFCPRSPLGEMPRRHWGRSHGKERGATWVESPLPGTPNQVRPARARSEWGEPTKGLRGGRSRRHDLRYFHGETGMSAPGQPATPIIVFEAPATVRGEFSQCSTQEKNMQDMGTLSPALSGRYWVRPARSLGDRNKSSVRDIFPCAKTAIFGRCTSKSTGSGGG